MNDFVIVLDDTEYWQWIPSILNYEYFFRTCGIKVTTTEEGQYDLDIRVYSFDWTYEVCT